MAALYFMSFSLAAISPACHTRPVHSASSSSAQASDTTTKIQLSTSITTSHSLHKITRESITGNVTKPSQAVRLTPRSRRRQRRASTVYANGQTGVVVSAEKDKNAQKSEETEEDYADFEVITDEDREKANQLLMKELMTYAGYTLLCVVISVGLVLIFLLDPRACIIAFATGSPCCVLFPCYREIVKYTDPVQLIRANVNIYIPGMYIQQDGKLKEYPPSLDEMDALLDLVGEFLTVE